MRRCGANRAGAQGGERGEYSPSLHLALRIARFFELPVEVVFSVEPFPRISDAERSA